MKTLITILLTFFCITTANASDDWIWTKGPLNGVISSLATNKNGDVFCGTNQGIFRLKNNGYWESINKNLAKLDIHCIAINPTNQNIFAGTYGAGIYRSSDNGDNWEPINFDKLSNYPNTSSICITNDGNIFCIKTGAGTGLFSSSNNGKNWTQIEGPTNDYDFLDIGVNMYGWIYCSSWDIISSGPYYKLIFSNDSGTTFHEITSNLPLADYYNIRFTTQNDIIVTTLSDGIYKTTNNGANWTTINNNLINKNIRALILGNLCGQLFTGGINGGIDGGVYRSINNGDSWEKFSNGLKYLQIYALAIDSSGYVYAGTDGGVYKTINSCISDVLVNKKIIKFELNISPNPTTDNITISYRESLNPSISIYNSLGIEIKRITDTELSGNSSINLTTDDFPSGIYYCSLNSGINKITKSFVVIR